MEVEHLALGWRHGGHRRPLAELLTNRGAADDALGAFYSALADDGAAAAQKREASMLFATAEAHLSDGGTPDHEEALRAALEASAAAKACGDLELEADAARLVVKSHCLKAFNLRYELGSEGAGPSREALAAGRRFAEEALVAFQRAADLRGQAAMQLSIAEVCLEDRRPDVRLAAEPQAAEAQAVFQRLGERRLEAAALLAIGEVHAQRRQSQQAVAATEAALAHFREAGDRFGEARALHACGVAHALQGSASACERGLRMAQDALALYEELGCVGLQALELLTVADLSVVLDRPRQAVLAAKEAVHLFKQIGYGRGSEAVSLAALVEALTESDQLGQALQASSEGVARFRRAGDRRQEAMLHDILARAHLEKDDPESALESARAGLLVCQELRDHRLEACLLLTLSQAQAKSEQVREALVSAQDASAIFRALDDEWYSAGIAQYHVAELTAELMDVGQAIEEAMLARDFFYKIDNCRCEGLAMLQVAAITGMLQGKQAEAVGIARQARDHFRLGGDRSGEALALHVSAELQRAADELGAALQDQTERRKIVQELGFIREEAKCLHALAVVHLARGGTAEASRAAREGLQLARSAGDRALEVRMLLQVVHANTFVVADGGGFEKQQRVAEEAVKVSRDAVAIARKVAAGRLRAPALLWNAYALGLTPLASEALDVADEALRLFQAGRDKLGEAYALVVLAQAHFAQDKSRDAAEAANAAVGLFRELGHRRGEDMAAALLQQIAPSMGQQQQQQQQQQLEAAAHDQAPAAESVAAAPVPRGLDPDMTRKQILKIAADAIGDEAAIEVDSPLMEMGLDSLSSVALRNSLAQEFRMSLTASVMFDYPSVGALTEHIVEKSIGNA